MDLALKFVGPDTIEGLAIPFGSPDDLDTDGEFFSPATDLCLDWFGKSGRPALYDHGLDAALKTALVGRQTDYDVRDDGIWAQSQLDRNAKYRKAIDRLVNEGALGYSSGAMAHLAQKDAATGEITRWPWVELSLTPIPANPATLGVHYVKSSDAIARLVALDGTIPDPLKAAVADEWAASNDNDALPDGAKFADILDRLTDEGPPWVKARRDWFAKSGRVLSKATRDRLTAHPQALRQLADDLDELLASADAPKDEAKFAAILRGEAIRTEATLSRLLGVEVPALN